MSVVAGVSLTIYLICGYPRAAAATRDAETRFYTYMERRKFRPGIDPHLAKSTSPKDRAFYHSILRELHDKNIPFQWKDNRRSCKGA